MANTYSALKRVRQEARRTAVNRARRTQFRRQIRALRLLIEKKDVPAAQAALPKTFSLIDRAAKWGVVKKNTAARYKSRLSATIVRLAAA